MKRAILIHYHEINLKGNNRGWFETCLERHVVRILGGLATGAVRRFAGRLLVELVEGSPVAEITRRLGMVFGIANFTVAREVPAEIEAIEAELAALVSSTRFHSFKMDCRRGTKEFPLDSQQLNRRLGAFVQERTGAEVRMEGPEAVFGLEIVKGRAFLFLSRIAGAGGLPSGSGGKVLSLLSGGIDSPVAAWRMMRRGCRVHHVHFHSYPHTTVESQEKVRRLLGILSRFQLESTLWMVPFAEVQREIVAYAPPALRVILYRRFMVRIAEAVAHREKAAALVTGDSLGQVASQTLENIRTISAVATMPVFRPLIGNDKEEIIRIARAIGTYETSIQADQDCCSLFIPRHPETAADPEKAERAESVLHVARLVENALAGATRETLPADFAPLPDEGRRDD